MTILSRYLPQIDLHGLDRDYARILVNEFIEDKKSSSRNIKK